CHRWSARRDTPNEQRLGASDGDPNRTSKRLTVIYKTFEHVERNSIGLAVAEIRCFPQPRLRRLAKVEIPGSCSSSQLIFNAALGSACWHDADTIRPSTHPRRAVWLFSDASASHSSSMPMSPSRSREA